MEKNWVIKTLKNVQIKNPVILEGLPGMGNVGKITVDFIIESLKAVPIYQIYSYEFPNCVFVNKDGVTELPRIDIYHKKIKGNDLILVAGDMQPIDEKGCYELCDRLLDLFQKSDIKQIITLAGIGLNEAPKKPKLYCAANDKKLISRFSKYGIESVEGIVGPIIGVSGLLVGLAGQRNIKGVVLLAETLGVPNYLGIKESRELLTVLNSELNLGLDIKKLNKEVNLIEKEINEKMKNFLAREERKIMSKQDPVNYIG